MLVQSCVKNINILKNVASFIDSQYEKLYAYNAWDILAVLYNRLLFYNYCVMKTNVSLFLCATNIIFFYE